MILAVDTQSPLPIYQQLRDQIVLGIAGGQLAPHETLPSVRCLSADLGINLHTVNKAYSVLCDEGYIVMDRRKGATVAGKTPVNAGYLADITYRLVLSAAEVRCHGMDSAAFSALCRECYKKAGNETNKEESSNE